MGVSLEKAQALVNRAVEAGKAQSVAIAAVVVDAGGNVVASARMDKVGFMGYDAAVKKARTSASFGAPTAGLADFAKRDAGIGAALNGDPAINILPGGFPLKAGDDVIGGLGIAGGHYLQDQAVAEYALAE